MPPMPFEEVAERCAQRLFPDDPEFQAHFIKGVTEVRNKFREKYARPAEPPAETPAETPAPEEAFA